MSSRIGGVRRLGYHAAAAQPQLPFGRGVAQPGSALAWGARGREFESRRPDQLLVCKVSGLR